MEWMLIGVLFASTITSQHPTREACEGRAVVLREKGALVRCVTTPNAEFTVGIGNSTSPLYTTK